MNPVKPMNKEYFLLVMGSIYVNSVPRKAVNLRDVHKAPKEQEEECVKLVNLVNMVIFIADLEVDINVINVLWIQDVMERGYIYVSKDNMGLMVSVKTVLIMNMGTMILL